MRELTKSSLLLKSCGGQGVEVVVDIGAIEVAVWEVAWMQATSCGCQSWETLGEVACMCMQG